MSDTQEGLYRRLSELDIEARRVPYPPIARSRRGKALRGEAHQLTVVTAELASQPA